MDASGDRTKSTGTAPPTAGPSTPPKPQRDPPTVSPGLPDYSSDEDHRPAERPLDDRRKRIYTRSALLKLYHARRAEGLPAELLGHDVFHEHHPDHAEGRHRHRTTTAASDAPNMSGGNRLAGGLRGRGGGGLQGGVLSGLGGHPAHTEVGTNGRPPPHMADVPPGEPWIPVRGHRKGEVSKADSGVWRRGTAEPLSAATGQTEKAPLTTLQGHQDHKAPHDDDDHIVDVAVSTIGQLNVDSPAGPRATTAEEPPSNELGAMHLEHRRLSPFPSASKRGSVMLDGTKAVQPSTSGTSIVSHEDEVLLQHHHHLPTKSTTASEASDLSRSLSSHGNVGIAPLPRDSSFEAFRWHYQDPSGTVQGPFPATQMQEWHAQGFFDATLMLNRVGEHGFVALGALVQLVLDPSQPFSSPLRARPPAHHPVAYSPEARHPPPPPSVPYHQIQASAVYHKPPRHQFDQPQRHFTNDYDPFGQDRARTLSPHHDHDVYGRTSSHQTSSAGDPWGHPPAPSFHGNRQDPWPLNSSISSRHPSISGSSLHDGRQSYDPAHGVRSSTDSYAHMETVGQHPWRQMSQASQTEVEPLLPRGDPILPQHGQTTQFSMSPIGSFSNLVALKESREPYTSPSREVDTTLHPLLDATPSHKLEELNSAPTSPPRSGATVADNSAASTLLNYADTSTESQPQIASAKKRSRRQAAKEAKEAARRNAVDAAALQPGDLSPSNVATADLQEPAATELDTSWQTSELERSMPLQASTKSAPWVASKDDGGGVSLRDIQAREARQSQARMAVEKQHRAAAVAAEAALLTAAETTAPLPTASTWAGGGQQASSAWTKASAPAPISTTPSAARSLKEIQEEETRRKMVAQMAHQQSMGVAGAAQRAAYAGSAKAAATKPAAINSAPWQTVGAGGKAASTPISTQPRTSGTTAASPIQPPRPAAPSKTASAARVTASNNDDPAPAPSPELIKWTRSSLHGFSANLDDFVQLLFSFPLDPDDLTREIISDTVYANSKTLDGKRFASDFVTRRKQDARGTLSPGAKRSTTTTTATMADAVKSQPVKVVQEPFKVVKAKVKKAATAAR